MKKRDAEYFKVINLHKTDDENELKRLFNNKYGEYINFVENRS